LNLAFLQRCLGYVGLQIESCFPPALSRLCRAPDWISLSSSVV